MQFSQAYCDANKRWHTLKFDNFWTSVVSESWIQGSKDYTATQVGEQLGLTRVGRGRTQIAQNSQQSQGHRFILPLSECEFTVTGLSQIFPSTYLFSINNISTALCQLLCIQDLPSCLMNLLWLRSAKNLSTSSCPCEHSKMSYKLISCFSQN